MAPVAGLAGIAGNRAQVRHRVVGAVQVAGAVHQQQHLAPVAAVFGFFRGFVLGQLAHGRHCACGRWRPPGRPTISPCTRDSCSSPRSWPAPPWRRRRLPRRAQQAPQLEGRKNQKVEHIRVEDEAVVIDEVRYAGQTQSVTVKPKGNLPEYEIQPTDMARSRPGDHRDGLSSATGKRVWNVLNF